MTIKNIRLRANMTQKEFAEYFGISQRTIENWDSGRRTPPDYVVELIKYKAEKERLGMLKLVLNDEGQEEVLVEGTLEEITAWLEDNYNIFDFIWEGVVEENRDISITTPYEDLDDEAKEIFVEKMPQLGKVETTRDLEYELEKVDLGWWVLKIV